MAEAEERVMLELNELQEKILVQADMMSRVQQQERMLAFAHKRAALTKSELSAMPDSTAMFKSIGKAYFCCSKPDVLRELDERAAQHESDGRKLREQRDAIDRSMRSTNAELEELLKQSPALARRLGGVRLGE